MTLVQNLPTQLLSVLLALGIPALIAAWAPRRWRIAALILWIISPVILLLTVGGIEAARNPASADLGKLLYGIALIGSLLGLPWLLACLLGFGLGSLLRRKRPPPAASSPPPPVAMGRVAGPVPAHPPVRPISRRAYGVAFLILIGAFVAIGVATLVTLRLSPDPPPPKLDRIPEMPRPR